MTKVRVSDGSTVATAPLPNAGYSNQSPWNCGADTDICWYVDAGGVLFVVHAPPNNGNIHITRVDPDSLAILQTWVVPRVKRSTGYAFVVCGRFYFGKSFNSKVIDGVYDTTTGVYDDTYRNSLPTSGKVVVLTSWIPSTNQLLVIDNPTDTTSEFHFFIFDNAALRQRLPSSAAAAVRHEPVAPGAPVAGARHRCAAPGLRRVALLAAALRLLLPGRVTHALASSSPLAAGAPPALRLPRCAPAVAGTARPRARGAARDDHRHPRRRPWGPAASPPIAAAPRRAHTPRCSNTAQAIAGIDITTLVVIIITVEVEAQQAQDKHLVRVCALRLCLCLCLCVRIVGGHLYNVVVLWESFLLVCVIGCVDSLEVYSPSGNFAEAAAKFHAQELSVAEPRERSFSEPPLPSWEYAMFLLESAAPFELSIIKQAEHQETEEKPAPTSQGGKSTDHTIRESCDTEAASTMLDYIEHLIKTTDSKASNTLLILDLIKLWTEGHSSIISVAEDLLDFIHIQLEPKHASWGKLCCDCLQKTIAETLVVKGQLMTIPSICDGLEVTHLINVVEALWLSSPHVCTRKRNLKSIKKAFYAEEIITYTVTHFPWLSRTQVIAIGNLMLDRGALKCRNKKLLMSLNQSNPQATPHLTGTVIIKAVESPTTESDVSLISHPPPAPPPPPPLPPPTRTLPPSSPTLSHGALPARQQRRSLLSSHWRSSQVSQTTQTTPPSPVTFNPHFRDGLILYSFQANLSEFPDVIEPKTQHMEFTDLHPVELARQLSLLDSRIFMKISSEELSHQAWNHKDELERIRIAPNACKMILHTNFISQWVSTEVVLTPNLKQRVCVVQKKTYNRVQISEFHMLISIKKTKKKPKSPIHMEFYSSSPQISQWVSTEVVLTPNLKQRVCVVRRFIQTAQQCRVLNNWNSLYAVCLGLASFAVSRLKKTWQGVPNAEKQFLDDTLSDLMQANMQNYRKKLQACSLPTIPYLAVWLKDLTFIEDANSDFVSDNIVNWEKMHMIASVFEKLHYYQSHPYKLKSYQPLVDYILHATIIPQPDKLTEKSLLCESSH
ncbi:Ras guanine nucleotide exchange factor [Pelomyxa schiedti]|nr:Ras guanine nucleotide exchange factor [Pelomyxa schiedti]